MFTCLYCCLRIVLLGFVLECFTTNIFLIVNSFSTTRLKIRPKPLLCPTRNLPSLINFLKAATPKRTRRRSAPISEGRPAAPPVSKSSAESGYRNDSVVFVLMIWIAILARGRIARILSSKKDITS